MYRFVLFFALQSLVLANSSAHAQPADKPSHGSDFYVGGSGALAYFGGIEGADYEFGFAISGLGGFEFRPNWRAEVELSYEAAEFENSADETSLIRISGGLYTDLGTPWREGWTPYVGGGVGIVSIDVGNDEDNVDISGHAEAGISLPLSDELYLVPGLRAEYIILDDIDDQIITQFRVALRLGL